MFSIFDQKMRSVQQIIEQNNAQMRLYRHALHKQLTNLEQITRKERRVWLNEQSIRLGRVGGVAGVRGSRMSMSGDQWEEGEAFRKVNQRLREIHAEKEEIEKLKKSRK